MLNPNASSAVASTVKLVGSGTATASATPEIRGCLNSMNPRLAFVPELMQPGIGVGGGPGLVQDIEMSISVIVSPLAVVIVR